MATVPYSEGIPSVEPSVGVPDRYLRIPSTPAEFGGLVGQGLQAFGQGALKAHQFYSEVAADDATNQYMEGARKILYGDPDKPWLDASGNPIPDNDGNPQPDRGLIGLQGEEAMRMAPQKIKELDDLRKRLGAGLLTGDSALKFEQETRRWQNYHNQQIGAHAEAESHKWAEKVEQATVNNRKGDIGQAAAAGKWDEVAVHERALEAAYIRRASRLGGGNELLTQARNQAQVESKLSQIEAVAPVDAAKAQDLLDANRELLARSGHYDAVNAMVTRLAHRDNVQKLTAIGRGEGGPGGAIGPKPTGPVKPEQFTTEATQQGIDPALVHATASIESDYGKNTGNSVSPSNTGIFQRAPANAPGGMNDSYENQIKLGVEDLVRERNGLRKNLGREPTNAEVYLAHQQGVEGATDLITNPTIPAGKVTKPINISNNGGDPAAPASAFISHWQRVYARHEGAVPIAPGTAAPTAGQLPAISPTVAADSLAAGLARIRNAPGSFSEADRAAAEQHFETQWRANLADISRLEAIQDKQRKQVEATALDGYTKQIINDPTQLDPQKVANDPSFAQNPHLRWQIMQMQHQALTQNQEKIADTSRAETVRLFDQMRRPGGDPQRMQDTGPLIDAMSAGKLRTSDFDWLMKSFADMRSPQGEKLATRRHEALGLLKSSITQSNELLGKRDAYGDAMLYMYDWTVDQKIDDYKKAGKDPTDLFNPKNPDYVGSPDFVRPFQGSFQQNIQRKTQDMLGRPQVPSYPDLTKQLEGETPEQWRHRLSMLGIEPPAAASPAVVPRLPGESPADYVKRVGAASTTPAAPPVIPPAATPPAPPIR